MDKKEFIFPGVILGIVLIIAIGLLLTQGGAMTPPVEVPGAATTTDTVAGKPVKNPATPGPGTITQYYPYGATVLKINQVAGFKDGLSIRPTGVVEDSRCPQGVMCIQAGTVKVTLKTSVSEVATMHTLALGDSITVHGDTIKFESVKPERAQGSSPASTAYTFTFIVTPGTVATEPKGQCYVGGCSSEICSDVKNQVSNCLYSPSFACYRTATCERQKNGACGWTETPALKKCLANPPTN